MSTVDLSNVSAKDLEKALKVKQKEEIKQREENKKAYEQRRDETVFAMIEAADVNHSRTQLFKSMMHQMFDEQKSELDKYAGGLSKHSKGGFSLTHSSGEYRVTRTLKSQPKWDERADEAVTLIKEFLDAKLKNTKHYSLIHTLLERNKSGELSYPMVMRLIEIKDEYDDKRWVKAMSLLIESFERVYSGYGYEFYRRNKEGQFEKIEINFTSL